jgi:hypothetical protein
MLYLSPDGEAKRPKLSDGGHEARRLQRRRDAAVRCSTWLGHLLEYLINAFTIRIMI